MTAANVRNHYAGNPAPAAGSAARTAVATWTAGDTIIVLGSTEDSSITLGTPTATGLGTMTSKAATATASSCWVGAWEGVATSSQTGVTVTSNISGSTSNQGWILVIVVETATMGSSPVYTAPTSTVAPLTSVTRGGTDSIVYEVGGDWGATAVRAASPSTNATVVVGQVVTGKYTAYGLRWTGQGAAGTTSYGLAGSNFADAFARVLVEIPGTSSGTSATATPARVSAAASVPAPTVTATSSASISPARVSAAATVYAPTVTVTASVTATPAQVSAVASVPAPTVTATSSSSVSPARVSAAASIPAPTVSTGSTYYAAANPSGSQFAASPFNDPQPINIGFVFNSTAPVTIDAIRYYKIGHGNDGQTITGSLYAVGAGGTPVAQATRVQQAGDPDGWISIPITPYAITPGQDYTAAAHLPLGWYVGGDLQDSISGQSYQGPLQSIAGASKYVYGAIAEPTGSGISYYLAVDAVAQGSASPDATASPSRVSAAASISTPTVTVASGSTATPAVVPAVAAIPAPSITTTGSATAAPARVAAAVSIPAPSVTTGTIFYAAANPTGSQFAASPFYDGQGINISEMFNTSATVDIIGIRYYKKGSGNDGSTITGSLYAVGAGGTPVAQATRVQSAGDPDGWVQIPFSTPYSISPGQDYKAAVHLPLGRYVGGDLQEGISGQAYQGPLMLPTGVSQFVYGASPQEPTGSALSYYLAVDAVGQGASAVNATATPARVSAAASIPTPTVTTVAAATPATVQVTTSIPGFVGSMSATAAPDAVAGSAAIPAPTVTATTSSSVNPARVSAVAVIPAPSVSAGGSATATPPTMQGAVVIPAPSVSTASSAAASPAMVSAVVLIPTPSVSAGSGAAPAPAMVQGAVLIPAPVVVVTGSSTATPALVQALASIPAPAVSGSASTTASPAQVSAAAAIPTPTIRLVPFSAPKGRMNARTSAARLNARVG